MGARHVGIGLGKANLQSDDLGDGLCDSLWRAVRGKTPLALQATEVFGGLKHGPAGRDVGVDPQHGHVETDRILHRVHRPAGSGLLLTVPDDNQQVRLVEHHPPCSAVGRAQVRAPAVQFEPDEPGAGLRPGEQGAEGRKGVRLLCVLASEVGLELPLGERHRATEGVPQRQSLLGEDAVGPFRQRRDSGQKRRVRRI